MNSYFTQTTEPLDWTDCDPHEGLGTGRKQFGSPPQSYMQDDSGKYLRFSHALTETIESQTKNASLDRIPFGNKMVTCIVLNGKPAISYDGKVFASFKEFCKNLGKDQSRQMHAIKVQRTLGSVAPDLPSRQKSPPRTGRAFSVTNLIDPSSLLLSQALLSSSPPLDTPRVRSSSISEDSFSSLSSLSSSSSSSSTNCKVKRIKSVPSSQIKTLSEEEVSKAKEVAYSWLKAKKEPSYGYSS